MQGADLSGRRAPETAQPRALTARAHALAAYALQERLVLFLGAGVSVGAGLPTWSDLLKELAQEAGMTPAEREAVNRMHTLDQARIIEGRLATHGIALGARIAQRFDAAHYSLAHALLAAPPVNEAATMNYDCLYEEASAALGRPVAVLPYQAAAQHSRWLLTVHGCVTHPEDIVLTREDYLRYAERRATLAGIVQALLITRHMLFVGFSLTDDNFLRMADDVRRALGAPSTAATDKRPFGTALLL